MIARTIYRVKRLLDIIMKMLYNVFMQNNYKEVEKQAKELEKLARKMKREELMELRKQGWSLDRIGKEKLGGISRQRVQQILDEED